MDDIPASFLKTTSSVLAGPLCEIINHSFSEGKFPTEWKCAKIIALYKGGKRSVCDNYRPISVLPVLSKIMEKHISDSFYKYLTDNQLLCSNQSGFRPWHSCQTVLVNIVNDFNVAMNQGNTSTIADARHQEVLPSANSISKYGVTQSYFCCVRETFV